MSQVETANSGFDVDVFKAAAPSRFQSEWSAQIISGQSEILACKEFLVALSERCGQMGAMDHLECFLTSQNSLKKIPHLILVGPGLEHSGGDWRNAIGAVLVLEYRLLGLGMRVFSTEDTSGRRSLIAPKHLRMQVARLVAETLMRRGAFGVLESMLLDGSPEDKSAHSFEWPAAASGKKSRWVYATSRRLFWSYLPLASTVDATLAQIGQKTRANLRYYRRRAEAKLGSNFVAEVAMERAEFCAFDRRCSFAVGDERAEWRYEMVTKYPGTFLCGIRDKDGTWLSLTGGRRFGDAVEIDWQMNRSDLPEYSVSIVMRAYFIEHEISLGTKRMYIEGGTPHSLRRSFERAMARDLVVLRYPLLSWALRRFAKRWVPKTNFLMGTLSDRQLRWQYWT